MTADTEQPTLAVMKTCPFCGCSVDIVEREARDELMGLRKWFHVEGKHTGIGGVCPGQVRARSSRETAIAAWNTRTTHEPRPAGDLREAARRIATDTIGVQGSLRDDYIAGVFDNGDHVRIAAAALATHSPAPMTGWRSMNDAPKDGTQILAWFWSALVGNGYGWADTIRWWNGMWWDDRDGPCEPVAWMPRPAPPAAAHPSTQEGGK